MTDSHRPTSDSPPAEEPAEGRDLERHLFDAAIRCPLAERDGFLSRACGDDAALHLRLQQLLAAHAGAGEASELLVPASDAALPATDAVGLEGETIGPYRVLEELGRGGMAVVYLAAQQRPVKRHVALKVIKLGMDTREVLARFESERQALALMSHPNIARIHDAGTTDRGRPYFVMEYVRGAPIQAFCDERSFDTRTRLRLFADVCQAVEHAHMKGVIHRDLKPSNLLVTEEGGRPVAKVIDFGVAKATHQRLSEQTLYTEIGRVIGTPEYMSPEQADRSVALDVDTRSDVYSLGVVLFELLTGTLPFDFRSLREHGFDEFRRTIREQEPPALATAVRRTTNGGDGERIARSRGTTIEGLTRVLRDELSWITLRALDKNPGRRYQGAREFGEDIERYLAGEPVAAGPPSGLYRLRKRIERHRFALAFACTIVALLIVLVVSTLVQSAEIRREAERANQQARAAEQAARIATEAADAERIARRHAAENSEAARRESQVAARISAFLLDLFRASRPGEVEDAGKLTARDLLDRGARRIRSELRDDVGVQAALMIEIGSAYDQLGAYQEATNMLEEALTLTERGDPGDARVAAALWELGQNYRKRGRYEDAERAFRRLVALREDGDDQDALAAALDGLGAVFSDSNRAKQAIPLFDRAIELRSTVRGSDDASLEVFYNNLGVAQYRVGDLAEAARSFAKVVAIYERIPSDPSHAYVHVNLGSLLRDLGEFAAAEDNLERAMTIVEASFDADHQLVGAINISLAELYTSWPERDPALAEACFDKALATRRRTLPNHPILAQTMRDFGGYLCKQGRFDRALSLFEEAHEIWRRTDGAAATLASLDIMIVHAMTELGRADEALVERARRAVAILESAGGGRERLLWSLRMLLAAELAVGDAAGAAMTRARVTSTEDGGDD